MYQQYFDQENALNNQFDSAPKEMPQILQPLERTEIDQTSYNTPEDRNVLLEELKAFDARLK